MGKSNHLKMYPVLKNGDFFHHVIVQGCDFPGCTNLVVQTFVLYQWSWEVPHAMMTTPASSGSWSDYTANFPDIERHTYFNHFCISNIFFCKYAYVYFVHVCIWVRIIQYMIIIHICQCTEVLSNKVQANVEMLHSLKTKQFAPENGWLVHTMFHSGWASF